MSDAAVLRKTSDAMTDVAMRQAKRTGWRRHGHSLFLVQEKRSNERHRHMAQDERRDG